MPDFSLQAEEENLRIQMLAMEEQYQSLQRLLCELLQKNQELRLELAELRSEERARRMSRSLL